MDAAELMVSQLHGAVLRPGDEGYDAARAAWNLNADQRPAVVVMAESAADILAAVRLARAEGLGVGVMATGHGVSMPPDGGVLVNTSRMTGVAGRPGGAHGAGRGGGEVARRRSRGAEHGLAGLTGSASGSASSATRWVAGSAGWAASTASPPARSSRPRW